MANCRLFEERTSAGRASPATGTLNERVYGALRDEIIAGHLRPGTRLMRLNWVKATHYRAVPKDWHQQLREAIGTRDPDRAEAKMREHFRYGCEDDRGALRFVLEQAEADEK